MHGIDEIEETCSIFLVDGEKHDIIDGDQVSLGDAVVISGSFRSLCRNRRKKDSLLSDPPYKMSAD